MLENDLVEAIIGLPTDMFYNTGISTYVWMVSNRKPAASEGQGPAHRREQLLPEDAEEPRQQAQGTEPRAHRGHHRMFGDFEEVTRDGVPISRIFKNEDFGYRTITVERPERDAKGKVVLGTKGKGKGKPVPDANLRDTENVPLSEDVETYFKREVLPHAPTPGSTTRRRRSGTRSPSTATSTSSSRRARSPRSTPT
jgi:type I restriction enzyme M protein